MALAFDTHRLPGRLTARRWEIFSSAAPMLDVHGFYGVTVDAVAHACLMSPAGLYHYFPSKLSMALFPLSGTNGLCADLHRKLESLSDEPLVQLNGLLDYIASVSGELRLAVRLCREIGGDQRFASEVARSMSEAQSDFRMLARSSFPDVSEERADDLFTGVIAVIVSVVPGADSDPAGLRRRLGDVARGWVTSLGITHSDFDAAALAALEAA